MRNDEEILADYDSAINDFHREKLFAEIFLDIKNILAEYQSGFKSIAERLALKTLLEIREKLLGFQIKK